MQLCSVLYASLDGKGLWGRMDTCICMVESPPCPPETTIPLLIGYTPIQNKKLQVKNKLEKKRTICLHEVSDETMLETVLKLIFPYNLSYSERLNRGAFRLRFKP